MWPGQKRTSERTDVLDLDFFAKLKEVVTVTRHDRLLYAMEKVPLTMSKYAGYQLRGWPEGERAQLVSTSAESLLVLLEAVYAHGIQDNVANEMRRILAKHEERAVRLLELKKEKNGSK